MTKEKKTATLTVILTVGHFCREELAGSMDSVLNQEGQVEPSQLTEQEERRESVGFTIEQLILVDLTMDSACMDWLQGSYENEERILLLKPEERISEAAGINWAAECATGRYIAFLHSGTQWARGKLARQIPPLERSSGTDWIYGIAAKRGEHKVYLPNPALPPFKKAGALFGDLIRENTICPDTVVMRRQAYIECGGMDPDLPALAAEEFFLRFSLLHPVAYIEQVLAVSSMEEGEAESRLAVRLLLLAQFRDKLQDMGLAREALEGIWQEAKKNKMENIFWRYAEFLQEDDLYAKDLQSLWRQKHPVRELLLSKEPTVAGVVNCVGCCGCESVCPVGAITMTENKEGFPYPRVDEDTCILCRKCLKVCPTQQQLTSTPLPERCYALWGDEEAQRDSSSGGIFPLLAEAILNRGGCVVGAVYGKNFRVHHLVSNQKEDIFRMRSSKYVQSDTRGVFAEIKKRLDEGTEILFSGCACQVAGLKGFLGKEYPKLYTVDVVCHGVPSPRVFESYLKEHERQAGPIKEVNFRKKEVLGWKSGIFIQFRDGRAYTAKGYDPYMAVFLNDWGLRESCYQCEFKAAKYGDITLGDFWGIERLDTQPEKGGGTSVVTVNTNKGVQLLGDIRSRLKQLKVFPTEKAVLYNPSMLKPVRRRRFRDLFFESFHHQQQLPEKKRCLQQAIVKAFSAVHFDLGLVLWWSPNYGNAMTNYALYKSLEKEYSLLAIDNLTLYPAERFERFARQHYNLSSDYFPRGTRDLVVQSCDAFVVGSDQTWNYYFEQQCNCGKYFQLDFVPDKKKKLSYGASFGMEGAEPPKEEYASYYRRFDGISVREQFGVESCRSLYGAEAVWVLDPVFLLSEQEYEPLVRRAGVCEHEPFIMAYLLNPTPEKRAACKKIQESLGGIKMINVSENSASERERNRHLLEFENVLGNIEVEDWVYYMKQAAFVVTDSFHGTCFSLIFKKPFLSFVNRQPGRFQVFERFTGISERIVKSIELSKVEKYLEEIDYGIVEKELNEAREASLSWLKKQLE